MPAVEIAIASGKGGVGKTTLSSSLIYYFFVECGVNLVGVDADVDAPNLDIYFGESEVIYERTIKSSRKAFINKEKCSNCGLCIETCKFNALEHSNPTPKFNVHLCEGCGACRVVCPNNAIDIKIVETGKLLVRRSKHGIYIITGELRVGEHNSGNLVNLARALGREYAYKTNSKLIVIDAAPGIGCPVVSSITGTHYLIAVTEPSPFALDNLDRLVKVAEHFKVQMGVVINKYDISTSFTDKVKYWLKEKGIDLLGLIPYDRVVVNALSHLKTVLEFDGDSRVAKVIRDIGSKVMSTLNLG